MPMHKWMFPKQRRLDATTMWTKFILLFLVVFTDSIHGRNAKQEVRTTLLPPCSQNDVNPFHFSGNVVKVDSYKFALNGSLVAERKLNPPAEVS